jgi:fructokinase
MRLGIDLGGTKTEIVALAADGAERLRRRIATPRGSYAGLVAALAALVAEVDAALGSRGSIGIGIPGVVSPATGLVKNANTTELIGHPFDRDLAAAIGRPVRLENDANCFALSEASDGAGTGAAVVLALILGTGAGAGITVDGRVVKGRHRIAGEWGHNPLPRPTAREIALAPACYCGRHGCNEAWISGPAFAADHARETGALLEPAAILAAADAGDAGAQASFERYVDRLGRALAGVVNILDPDVIVIGGGMGRIGRLYAALPDAVRPHVFSDSFDTPVRPPRHGDASGVRGAAWLWPQGEGT